MPRINSITTDYQIRALGHKSVPKAIRKCQDCLRKSNKPLRQLSDMALALNMWNDVNEWDTEEQ